LIKSIYLKKGGQHRYIVWAKEEDESVFSYFGEKEREMRALLYIIMMV